MKIKFTFLFFITCLPFIIIAQNIKGTVTDATKSPLIGVSILLKGTNTGTVTDLDGNFSIDAKSGVLVFSYIGYITQEINISGKQDLNVQLEEDNKVLNTLVVVGYDLQKKKEITSSVVVIDEKALKDRPMVSAAEALQGKAAGVQVTQPSGKPGGDIAVRVRGATSVLAGNEPLYVVDGVPTTDIRGLNPIDILTMTVLKDASSSAIYGARAANGVVLISTKRGKADAPVARFNTYYGVSYLRKTIDVLTTKKYRELMVELNPNNIDVITSNNSDWSSQVFGQGNIQNYQLSFSGGTEKSRYFVSGGYLDNNGIIKPSKFNRYSIRMNLDNQLNTWLKLTTNVNLLQSKTKDTPDNASSGRGGVIMSALNTPPFLRVYKSDGSGWFDPNPFQPSWENPIAYMQGADQLVTDTRVFGNISAEANIIENLTAKSTIGIDLNNHEWDYYLDPIRTTYGRSQNGIGRSDKNTNKTWLWENTLLYKESRGNHNYSLLAGSSLQKNNYNDTYAFGYDFPKDTKVKTLNAANVTDGTSFRTEWALASFFGRFTYDYKSTYLFTASFRRDGSSKLSNPWGTMPAVSAGWRISEEKFLKNVKNLDDLKVRIGWGINGNQEGISPYAKLGLVTYFPRTPTNPPSGPGFAQTSYGNPDLKWETTSQTNIGFDLTMFKSRMQLAVDLYNKNTKDVLLNVQLPSSLPINKFKRMLVK
ncbi:MAG: SusC/RagA family TonB-linked outer membrane protein [Saprospiraceae bacterium]|nr:SusC/RagA family TonB-linked outer membrane protein [Saprospiraceae bacterium]